MTNSNVEGNPRFPGLCGYTMRCNLKGQDPGAVMERSYELIRKMKELGAFRRW
ncbi:MAG: hypothetical protein JRN37_02010 [Nitrososphaerota archaeon]|jgi:hypothetical protein|nr:hypothetical protein [Nitrososphaerota archaeon]MDG7037927.1 hypothetical protein [Nitrososphaerota archaeon]